MKRPRTRLVLVATLAALGLLAVTCAVPRAVPPSASAMQIQSHPWFHERHHAEGGGFANTYGAPRPEFRLKAVGWVLGHAFQSKENEPPPVRALDAAALATPPAGVRITWIGHATMLLQLPGLTVLTDPMFSHRASPVGFAGPEREVPLPISAEALPPIDVVILSHDHYDHLDEASIQALETHHQPLFLAPLGVDEIVLGWGGRRVVALDWWQFVDVGGWRIHGTPARHFSGRGLTNRDGTLWASYFLESLAGSGDVYFAGDTGYSEHFTEIRERLGVPEVVLMPIGAYRPRWFMEAVHVDPAEAVQAFLDLQGTHLLPIHWGTFDLADEPLQEPPALTREAARTHGIEDRLHLMEVGEMLELPVEAAASEAPPAEPPPGP